MKKYYVYILKCNDDSLYTGYTVDLEKRLSNHLKGLASKYTRSRLPVTMVYSEEYSTRSDAMSREALIKRLSRKEKLKLINLQNNKSPIG